MLLAGDIGGTKTLLGLFERGEPRPQPLHVDEFITLDHDGLESILTTFLEKHGVRVSELEASSFGVAGAITDQVAQLTNVPWRIDAGEMMRHGFRRVRLLNDLEAMAYAIPVLAADELAILQEGVKISSGNVAVIAAGTGLGEGMLLNIGGRLVPGQSEGGHADFAARTDKEFELVRMLRDRHGRAEVEQVLSGPGLLNIHRLTHRGGECEMVEGVPEADAPARVTQAGLTGRCQGCSEALRMFVAAYGAEAGNLALRGVATAGLFIGGGIAPKIIAALKTGLFMDAFLDKAPLHELLERVPVNVILNPAAGLLGAAVYAQESARP